MKFQEKRNSKTIREGNRQAVEKLAEEKKINAKGNGGMKSEKGDR